MKESLTNFSIFVSPSETKLSDTEALEEIRQLSVHLQRIQQLAPAKGVAVMTISSLLEGLKSTQHQISISKDPPISSDLDRIQQNNNSLGPNSKAINQAICGIDKSLNTSMSLLIREENYDYVRGLVEKHPSLKCCSCKQYRQQPLSCKQMGSPPSHGSISFSNIKLDCMCSYEGDEFGEAVDRYHRQIKYRGDGGEEGEHSCASKHRYLSSSSLVSSPTDHKHHQKCTKSNDYIKQICDNCKKSSSLSKKLGCTGVEGGSSTATGAADTTTISVSTDNIVAQQSISSLKRKKKTKSTDNMTFQCDDGDDDQTKKGDGEDEESNSSSNSQVLTRENSRKSNKRSDKLLLDLNDKSKYTKEVSV